jgi:hypothetical protein
MRRVRPGRGSQCSPICLWDLASGALEHLVLMNEQVLPPHTSCVNSAAGHVSPALEPQVIHLWEQKGKSWHSVMSLMDASPS